LSIVSSVLVVRLIGAEGRGIISFIETLIMLFTTVTFFSLGSGLIFESSKTENKNEFISSGIFFAAICSFAMIIFILVFNKFLQAAFLNTIDIKYLYIGLCYVPIFYVKKITEATNRAILSTKLYNYELFINKFLYIILIIILWVIFNHMITEYIMLAAIGANAVGCLFVILKIRSLLDLKSIKIASIAKMIRFGMKEHFGVISQKLNLRFDTIIINAFLLPIDLGYYAIAVSFAELVWFVPDSIGIFLFPKIAGMPHEDKTIDYVTKLCRITITFLIITLVPFIIFISFIIPILYGDDFYKSVIPFIILMPGVLLLSITKILTKYFSGTGKPFISSLVTIISLIVNIPLLLILIPIYGISGAALSSTLAYAVSALVSIYFLKLRERQGNITSIFFATKGDIKEIRSQILKIHHLINFNRVKSDSL